jgi:hypothetical protein
MNSVNGDHVKYDNLGMVSPEATNALVDKWIEMAQTITEPKIASSHNSKRQL